MSYLFGGIAVMALLTYLIRVLPLGLVRGQIKNQWLKSFLYYIPYGVLGAMTFPAIFYCTGQPIAAIAGTAAAILLAYFDKGLLLTALGAALAVFAVSFLG